LLQDQIKVETTEAMKARNTVKLNTLRGLTAAFTNELVAKNEKPDGKLSDEDVIIVIRREVKKRKEAAEAFEKGGRTESAAQEREEQEILQAYLPQMMSEDEIRTVVEVKKTELGVSEKKDMGRLMGVVMGELKGKADGDVVKEMVSKSLA